MSYTRPPSTAVTFTWQGASAYSRPAADSVTFSWAEVGGVSLAEGFVAAQFGTPGTPLQAQGLSPTQFGAPDAFFNQAQGLSATSFGSPRLTQLSDSEGALLTQFGAPEGYIYRASGFSPATFGAATQPSKVDGFLPATFGTPFGGPSYLTTIDPPGLTSPIDDWLVTKENGVWFALTGGLGQIMSTDDGLSWTPLVFTGPLAGKQLYNVAYGNGVWVGTFSGTPTSAAYSTDLLNWTVIPVPSGMTYWPDIYFGNGVFYSDPHRGGSSSVTTTFAKSADATTWTVSQWEAPSRYNDDYDHFVLSSGTWWISFPEGLYKSTDLQTWAFDSVATGLQQTDLYSDGTTLYRLDIGTNTADVSEFNVATGTWAARPLFSPLAEYFWPMRFMVFGGDLFVIYEDSSYSILYEGAWVDGKIYDGYIKDAYSLDYWTTVASQNTLMMFGYDGENLSFTVDYYGLMGIDASGGGVVEDATGFGALQFSSDHLGFNHGTAQGFAATQFAIAYYPFWQVEQAVGTTHTRFGKPWGYEFVAPLRNAITKAASLRATQFGLPTSPVEQDAQTSGATASQFGTPRARWSWIITHFGVPQAREAQNAQGTSVTQFSEPRLTSLHTANGFRGAFGTASSERTQQAIPVYRPTRWGRAKVSQTDLYFAYSVAAPPRFGFPTGRVQFNYAVQGFNVMSYGEHQGLEAHRAHHLPPTSRFGTPLVQRNPTC